MPPMPPTPESAELDTPAAPPRPALGRRIAERLPEILIEALFTLVAVVLAFAVEEWREERELDGLAAEARGAILQEVTRNRDELMESKQGTTDATAALYARRSSGSAARHTSRTALCLSIYLRWQ